MSQERSDLSKPAPERHVPVLWLVLAGMAGLLLLRSVLPKPSFEGKKLTSLSIQPLTFTGDAVTLDDLRGKVVVLNFWGPWCPPCRMELPHIAELANYYEADGRCRVLAVSCGFGEPDPVSSLPNLKEQTDELLSSMNLKLDVYADPDGRTREAVGEAVEFGGYPMTLVLDAQGVIRKVWAGYAPGDEQEMAQVVASLLAETGA